MATTPDEIEVGVEFATIHPLLEREVTRILALGRPGEEQWPYHSR